MGWGRGETTITRMLALICRRTRQGGRLHRTAHTGCCAAPTHRILGGGTEWQQEGWGGVDNDATLGTDRCKGEIIDADTLRVWCEVLIKICICPAVTAAAAAARPLRVAADDPPRGPTW